MLDAPLEQLHLTPLRTAGVDDVLVGRPRPIESLPNGLFVFASGENLRKGNALNAVQIAESILAHRGDTRPGAVRALRRPRRGRR